MRINRKKVNLHIASGINAEIKASKKRKRDELREKRRKAKEHVKAVKARKQARIRAWEKEQGFKRQSSYISSVKAAITRYEKKWDVYVDREAVLDTAPINVYGTPLSKRYYKELTKWKEYWLAYFRTNQPFDYEKKLREYSQILKDNFGPNTSLVQPYIELIDSIVENAISKINRLKGKAKSDTIKDLEDKYEKLDILIEQIWNALYNYQKETFAGNVFEGLNYLATARDYIQKFSDILGVQFTWYEDDFIKPETYKEVKDWLDYVDEDKKRSVKAFESKKQYFKK